MMCLRFTPHLLYMAGTGFIDRKAENVRKSSSLAGVQRFKQLLRMDSSLWLVKLVVVAAVVLAQSPPIRAAVRAQVVVAVAAFAAAR